MFNLPDELSHFTPAHSFFVAIDSDGCAFDTMELKQKECFIPNLIKYYRLQPISKYARTVAEFVNLYSKWRGINRFHAIIKVFDFLGEWVEIQNHQFILPDIQSLRRWVIQESKLGNPALESEVARTADPGLKQALDWSKATNHAISEIVHGVPPFPLVKESLEKLSSRADLMVCSATPIEALRREWQEHGIVKYIRLMAGQEMGSKRDHLHVVGSCNYSQKRILMVGDALGDLKAAKENGVLFYPIIPGHEEASWERFYREIIDLFINDRFSKNLEMKLIKEFEAALPDTPPWFKS